MQFFYNHTAHKISIKANSANKNKQTNNEVYV